MTDKMRTINAMFLLAAGLGLQSIIFWIIMARDLAWMFLIWGFTVFLAALCVATKKKNREAPQVHFFSDTHIGHRKTLLPDIIPSIFQGRTDKEIR